MAFDKDISYIPVTTIKENGLGVKQMLLTAYVNVHTYLDSKIIEYTAEVSASISSQINDIMSTKYVKLTGDSTIDGKITANELCANNLTAYENKIASSTTLGCIKVGNNLAINNGVLSARPPTELVKATTDSLGCVKIGNNIEYNDSTGQIYLNLAATDKNGLMSIADKTKLDGISEKAVSIEEVYPLYSVYMTTSTNTPSFGDTSWKLIGQVELTSITDTTTVYYWQRIA